jgi:putative FmdB family regulatory protein
VPIYDYVCSKCHRLTEVVHGIAAEGPHFCPECGAEGTMTKVFSAPSVHFKGSGWAKKDRSSSSRAAARSKENGGTSDAKGDGAPSTGKAESSDSSGASKDASTDSGDKTAPSKNADKAEASRAKSGSSSPSGSSD